MLSTLHERRHNAMRQLAAGLAIGFLFGAALAASAGYIDHDHWTQIPELERLGYVAGVTDAVESIHAAIQALGTDDAAKLVATADGCTGPLKLGEVLDIAKSASIRHADVSPATALILDLVDCSPQTPQPSQSAPSPNPSALP
jgi:hypothetical protein